MLPVIGLALTQPASAQRPWQHLVDKLQAMDAAFVCPETLADEATRKRENRSFGHALASERLTAAQITKVRQNFLTRHACGGFGQPAAIQSFDASSTRGAN